MLTGQRKEEKKTHGLVYRVAAQLKIETKRISVPIAILRAQKLK